MKQFFKYVFASSIGVVLGLIILIFLFVGVAGIFSSSLNLDGKDSFELSQKSYLHLNLNNGIIDQGQGSDLNFPHFFNPGNLGLNVILKSIEEAKEDSLIQGIYLECGFSGGGHASAEEIRNALLDFKSSGKWVVAYAEIFSQKGYYIATAADELYMFPKGAMEWKGLGRRMSFFKGFFDKTGIEMQVIRGSNNKFKSAVEPFLASEISEANREQVSAYQRALWTKILKGVSDARGITISELNELAESLEVSTPEVAVEQKMIDQLAYEDEVIDILKAKMKLEEGDKLPAVGLGKYSKRKTNSFKDLNKDKIAVLYAQGEITSGKADDNMSIASETIIKEIRKIAKNDKIKAVVLRVNSPGGSALASEAIWRELEILNNKKPLVVSMGNVAASGGYYISAGADYIIAQPNTITGSIGVFGTLPNIGTFMTKNFGITYSEVQTNGHATMGSVTKRLSEEEYLIIQHEVDRIYDVFTSRVADGRKMTQADVDNIGQGRVWAGSDALSLGLVDQLGGLEDAVKKAAELAELEEYTKTEYPKIKDPMEQLLQEFLGKTEDMVFAAVVGDNAELKELLQIKKMAQKKGVWAQVPFTVEY